MDTITTKSQILSQYEFKKPWCDNLSISKSEKKKAKDGA